MDLLHANLYREEDSFIYKLKEGEFDKGKFNQLVQYVRELNHKELSKEERLAKACELWAIAVDVVSAIAWDRDKMDHYFISNITEEEKAELLHNISGLANFFTYSKPIDGNFFL